MNAFLQNKQYMLLLGGGVLLLVFIFITAFFLLQPTTPGANDAGIAPTAAPSSPLPKDYYDPYSDEYKESVKKINEQEKSLLDQDEKVGTFIDSLPVQGINFTAAYDIATNSVTVTIPSSKRSEGEKEFDDYLQSNGIKNKAWIQNLTFRYRDIDPFEH